MAPHADSARAGTGGGLVRTTGSAPPAPARVMAPRPPAPPGRAAGVSVACNCSGCWARPGKPRDPESVCGRNSPPRPQRGRLRWPVPSARCDTAVPAETPNGESVCGRHPPPRPPLWWQPARQGTRGGVTVGSSAGGRFVSTGYPTHALATLPRRAGAITPLQRRWGPWWVLGHARAPAPRRQPYSAAGGRRGGVGTRRQHGAAAARSAPVASPW